MRKMIAATLMMSCMAAGLVLMLSSGAQADSPDLYLTSPLPAIQWQQSFGGSVSDYLQSLQQTSDGGFILGGRSSSAAGTGNKTSTNYGRDDFWVVKLNTGVVTVNEGEAAAAGGTFSVPDLADTVTIAASVGTTTQTGTHSGTWNWSYAGTDGPDQSQSVTITATDTLGTTNTVDFLPVVKNVAPAFDAGPAAVVYTAAMGGAAFGRTIAFTDPGTDVWSGTVNWGDGPDNEPLTISQAAKSFDLSHTYTAEGIYTVTVTLNDDDGGSTTDAFVVQSEWSVVGDVNSDCKVNVLDLIFIRNRLNSSPATGDITNSSSSGV